MGQNNKLISPRHLTATVSTNVVLNDVSESVHLFDASQMKNHPERNRPGLRILDPEKHFKTTIALTTK